MDSMQFSHALDRALRKIIIPANLSLGPLQLLKVYPSDDFYHINLNVDGDIPKVGVVFPTSPGEEPLIVFPLVLPM